LFMGYYYVLLIDTHIKYYSAIFIKTSILFVAFWADPCD
jgi:hypothetical protein